MERRSFLRLFGGAAAVGVIALVAPPQLWDEAATIEASPPDVLTAKIGDRRTTAFALDNEAMDDPKIISFAWSRAEKMVRGPDPDGEWVIVNARTVPNPMRFSTMCFALWEKVA